MPKGKRIRYIKRTATCVHCDHEADRWPRLRGRVGKTRHTCCPACRGIQPA